MRYNFFLIGWSLLIFSCSVTTSNRLPEKEGYLNEPYLEWEIKNPGVTGNKYDVIARAIFKHEMGAEIHSLMFYSGDSDIWKFRFTGTKTGRWTINTEGPEGLEGYTGEVIIKENQVKRNGFLGSDGKNWIWTGTNKAMIPQLVMAHPPETYWSSDQADSGKIKDDIEEFIVETGFTGFHFPGGGGWWFNIHDKKTTDEDGKPIGEVNPDPRTFEVFEKFLVHNYIKGGMVHFWMWGSDGYNHPHTGPGGIGGPMSPADKRILRYLSARLGPLPGWSIGYGFDLHDWIQADELQAWHDFMKEQLDGWEHILGARADNVEGFVNEKVKRNPFSQVYWTGDYAGYYDYRVPYLWYVKTLKEYGIPHFQEDRFRIREHSRWYQKDYTPEMTRRGLWHSTMAGGVANIWGNLLPHNDNNKGSQPYDNQAEGGIQGVQFKVDIKQQIKTYSRFWFGKNRWNHEAEYIRDNALAGNQLGTEIMEPAGGDYISTCLRDRENKYYIFYSENTARVKMDLRAMNGIMPAIAIDSKKTYQEIELGELVPENQIWKAPYVSDWAIAIGEF